MSSIKGYTSMITVALMLGASTAAQAAPTITVESVLSECRDPAAHAIDFEIVQPTGMFSAKVRITAVVKNVGNADFSGSLPQYAVLYEDDQPVKRVSFRKLAKQSQLRFSYLRNWDATSPREGEFPPEYKLVINYQADVRMDGEKSNNDCRQANNEKTTGSELINQLITRNGPTPRTTRPMVDTLAGAPAISATGP